MAILAVAAALPGPVHKKAHHAYHAQNPGCRTEACDWRVWRWWAANHRETVARTTTAESSGWAIPERIVMCESGGDWHALNPSGAGGAYQIEPGTWQAYGGSGEPQNASPAEQNTVASKLYAAEGTAPWTASQGCWG